MYNGLTTADKDALIKLKESGVKITTIISLRQSANTSLKSNYDNIDIDLALAQIAEMESNTEHTERYGEILADIENWPVWKREAFNSLATSKHATQLDLTDKPLTWNERINQMTAEEKAPYFVYEDTLIDWEDDYNGESTSTETPIYRSSLASDMFFYVEQDAINATVELLDSPYTEGVTK